MRHRYVTLDVFTDRSFAGNPLAVVLDARGLDDATMARVAREFAYSETTFVLPPRRDDCVRRVRIFTPGGEIPFAGHPTVGTAIALVREGYIATAEGTTSFAFDLDAGPTPVTVATAAGRLHVTFTAPRPPAVGVGTAPALVAAAVSLPPEAVDVRAHAPVDVGTGLDFVVARLADRQTLARAAIDPGAWRALTSPAAGHGVVLYVPDGTPGGVDVRMFAPGVGVSEDPATGSAAAALGGLLAGLDPRPDGTFAWTISQGVDMGRPSRIEVAVDKARGSVTAVRIGGGAVPVMDGWLELG